MASAVLSPSPWGGPQPPRPHPGQSHPAPSVASVMTSPSCSHFNCSSQLCSHAHHSSCPLNSQLGDGQTTMGCGGCPLRAATQSQWRGDHLTVTEPVRPPGAAEAHPAPGSTDGAAGTVRPQRSLLSISQCLCTQPFHPNTTYLSSRKSQVGKFPNTSKTPSIRTQNKPEVFTDFSLL